MIAQKYSNKTREEENRLCNNITQNTSSWNCSRIDCSGRVRNSHSIKKEGFAYNGRALNGREKPMDGNKNTERNSRNLRNTRPWMRSTIEFSVRWLEKGNGVGRERRDGHRVCSNLSRAPLEMRVAVLLSLACKARISWSPLSGSTRAPLVNLLGCVFFWLGKTRATAPLFSPDSSLTRSLSTRSWWKSPAR